MVEPSLGVAGRVSRYTFGDDASAAERMGLVAAAYEPTTRAFLIEHAPPRPKVVVDIGCGPGFSSVLLHEVLRPATLLGIDPSAPFLDMARQRLPGARFEIHDATVTPLPGSPADVIYARLVLAHLPEPLAVSTAWSKALAPGGRLLIEDLEDIDAPSGPLRDYDEVSAAIVRRAGGPMYAGAALAPLGGRTAAVTVRGGLAATIYLFNVRRWMHDPAVSQSIHSLAELEQGLEQVAHDDRGATLSWIVRQVVLTPS